MLARFEVEGSFDIHDPVHEALTLSAMRRALELIKDTPKTILKNVKAAALPALSSKSGHNIETTTLDKSVQQYVRGVVWPDDPKGWLFAYDSGTENYSTGAAWYEEFDEDEKDEPEELIARSHYGDLQFLHAMATADDEAAAVTKQKVMNWAGFLIDVATGRIDTHSKLSDIPFTKPLFTSYPKYTVKHLFVYAYGPDMAVRQRAAGALMHLIQDSHAAGHAERNASGEITQFQSYGSQDHKKHAKADKWGGGATLGEHIKNTPGAARAVEKCAEVLVMLDDSASTDEVLRYLDENVFKLALDVKAAGSGPTFAKKHKKKK